MPFAENQLIEFLRSRAQERWEAEHQPYLLSLVATDLRSQEKDYHEAIGEERLKAFVKRTGENGGYTLVEHPVQRPKVGVVPSGVEFSFDDIDESQRLDVASGNCGTINERERVVLLFLRALSRLPDPLLDEISISTKVLVRLLTHR